MGGAAVCPGAVPERQLRMGPACLHEQPPPLIFPSPRRYITAIQLTSQHLLRYLAVAVVVNKRRRAVLKDLLRVIAQETYE